MPDSDPQSSIEPQSSSRRIWRRLVWACVLTITLLVGVAGYRWYHLVIALDHLESNKNCQLLTADTTPQWLTDYFGSWVKIFDNFESISVRKATPKDLAAISRFDVKQLTILETDLTPAYAVQLQKISSIEFVDIRSGSRPQSPHSMISQEALQQLAAIPSLKLVFFYKAILPDNALQTLSTSDSIENLELTYVTFDTEELPHLANLATLRRLSLTGLNITDKEMSAVATLTQLDRLFIQDTRVSDYGLHDLMVLPNLSTFVFTNINPEKNHITGEPLKSFRSLPLLKNFVWLGNPISESAVKTLSTAPNLSYLNLRSTQIDEISLNYLEAALPDCNIDHDY